MLPLMVVGGVKPFNMARDLTLSSGCWFSTSFVVWYWPWLDFCPVIANLTAYASGFCSCKFLWQPSAQTSALHQYSCATQSILMPESVTGTYTTPCPAIPSYRPQWKRGRRYKGSPYIWYVIVPTTEPFQRPIEVLPHWKVAVILNIWQ